MSSSLFAAGPKVYTSLMNQPLSQAGLYYKSLDQFINWLSPPRTKLRVIPSVERLIREAGGRFLDTQ